MTKGLKIQIGKLLKAHNIPKYDNKIGSSGYYWDVSSSDPNIQFLGYVEHHTTLAKKMLPEVIQILKDNGYKIDVQGYYIYFN